LAYMADVYHVLVFAYDLLYIVYWNNGLLLMACLPARPSLQRKSQNIVYWIVIVCILFIGIVAYY